MNYQKNIHHFKILEISEMEDNTHLRTWIYGFLDASNAPFLCHNLTALVQEILVFLWENTANRKVPRWFHDGSRRVHATKRNT